MAEETVTPIRRKVTPRHAPTLSLVQDPNETVHRVSCMLKYMCAHKRDHDMDTSSEEDFALHMILRDLSDALDWAQEVARV